MTSVEKQKIASNFSDAADSYDSYAGLQREVAAEVFLKIRDYINQDDRILDLGCGTGYLAKFINTEIKNPGEITQIDIAPKMVEKAAKVKNTKTIVADMERLPLDYDQYDVVLSSLASQWCDLTKILREIKRVKKTGGLISLSTLGDDSFKEVKEEFPEIKFRKMLNLEQIKQAVETAKIANLKIKPVMIKQNYENLLEFIKMLKHVGATEAIGGKYLGKDYLKKLKDAKDVNVSWQIVYLDNS